MSPSIITYNSNENIANGKHYPVKMTAMGSSTALDGAVTSAPTSHLSSADVIQMEHEYGAHK
jgi:hypothetical protein